MTWIMSKNRSYGCTKKVMISAKFCMTLQGATRFHHITKTTLFGLWCFAYEYELAISVILAFRLTKDSIWQLNLTPRVILSYELEQLLKNYDLWGYFIPKFVIYATTITAKQLEH